MTAERAVVRLVDGFPVPVVGGVEVRAAGVGELWPDVMPGQVLLRGVRGLAGDVSLMARVRLMLPAALADWGLWRLRDHVRMCAAELVGNAVTHAAAPPGADAPLVSVCLRYWLGSALWLEVADDDPRMPRERPGLDPLAEHGRGLLIVRACSEGWWARRSATGGKVVYCRWTLSSNGGDQGRIVVEMGSRREGERSGG